MKCHQRIFSHLFRIASIIPLARATPALAFDPASLSYFLPDRNIVGQSLGPSCDPDKLPPAIPPKPDTIEDADWQFPFLEVPQTYLRGICLFHKSFGKKGLDGRQKQQNAEKRIESIQALTSSQAKGLHPPQRGLANLYEGLLHCEAALELEAKPEKSLDAFEKDEMCVERSMSLANFKDIDWRSLELIYAGENEEAFGFSALINRMGQCYRSLYKDAKGISIQCLETPTLSDAQEAVVHQEVRDGVINRYFGIASSSSGIVARKIVEADQRDKEFAAILDGAGSRKGILARVQDANASIDAMRSSLEQSALRSAIDQVSEAYKRAHLQARTILDEYDSWVKGLSEGPGGESSKLAEVTGHLSREFERLHKAVSISDNNATPRNLKQFKATVENLLKRDAESAQRIQTLCKVYACGLLNDRNIASIASECKDSGRMTPELNLDKNPLCVEGEKGGYSLRKQGLLVQDGDRTITVGNLCAQHGIRIDPNNPRKHSEGRACMNL